MSDDKNNNTRTKERKEEGENKVKCTLVRVNE